MIGRVRSSRMDLSRISRAVLAALCDAVYGATLTLMCLALLVVSFFREGDWWVWGLAAGATLIFSGVLRMFVTKMPLGVTQVIDDAVKRFGDVSTTDAAARFGVVSTEDHSFLIHRGWMYVVVARARKDDLRQAADDLENAGEMAMVTDTYIVLGRYVMRLPTAVVVQETESGGRDLAPPVRVSRWKHAVFDARTGVRLPPVEEMEELAGQLAVARPSEEDPDLPPPPK